MKTILLLAITILVSATAMGRATTKKIVVTAYVQTVPKGKKWILETDKITKAQLSTSVLNSNSECSKLFLATPGILMNVNQGTLNKSKGYALLFKNPEKVPFTNELTYQFTLVSFIDRNFTESEIKNQKCEDEGCRKMVFRQGENIFVSRCIESLEMIEEEMTAEELNDDQPKQAAIKATEVALANNFCIPMEPEKEGQYGTKPVFKDSLIKYIVFETNVVVYNSFKRPGGFDDDDRWTLLLNHKTFEIKSETVYGTYTVLSAKYNSHQHLQEFELADESGQYTHKLKICYCPSSKSYKVFFISNLTKDEYQFQQVSVKEIAYQNKQNLK